MVGRQTESLAAAIGAGEAGNDLFEAGGHGVWVVAGGSNPGAG